MKYLLMFLLFLAPSFGQDAGEKVSPPATPPPAASIVKPVALDAEFEELYGDYALLLQEIDRIETATGQVTITLPVTELRGRALAKEKKMQAWVDAHKVGRGWVLDWQKKEFHAPDDQAKLSAKTGLGSKGRSTKDKVQSGKDEAAKTKDE